MNELKIHDIKELSYITDYSLYIFIFLIILFILIVLSLGIYIYKFFKNKKESSKMKSFQIIKNVNFEDSKESSYIITKHARNLISTKEEKKLFDELIEELSQYKYKKNVGNISEQSKQKFKLFMDGLNVK